MLTRSKFSDLGSLEVIWGLLGCGEAGPLPPLFFSSFLYFAKLEKLHYEVDSDGMIDFEEEEPWGEIDQTQQ